MKEFYEIPKIEITVFDTDDIITVSTTTQPATFETKPGEGGGDFGEWDDF